VVFVAINADVELATFTTTDFAFELLDVGIDYCIVILILGVVDLNIGGGGNVLRKCLLGLLSNYRGIKKNKV
jgi:hypothetical protein